MYRLVNAAPVATPVQTGISDGKFIEVSGEGLKEGDEVEAVVIQVDGENQKLALSTRSQEK